MVNKRLSHLTASTLLLIIFIFVGCKSTSDKELAGLKSDKGAPEILAPMQSVIGSVEDWNAMPRYLRFDFRIAFNNTEFLFSENLWDRSTGNYRTRWTAAFQEGEVLGLVNINTGEGNVWLNGEPAHDSSRTELLGAARYRALNDTYWLIAPFKFTDPGAIITDEGMQLFGDSSYRRLHLSFEDKTGLTSGDQFWLYMNQETGLMDRWAFFLETFDGEASIEEASVWRWKDWTRFDDVLISTRRTMVRSPQFEQFKTGQIDFPVLRFLSEVDENVFEDPLAPLP